MRGFGFGFLGRRKRSNGLSAPAPPAAPVVTLDSGTTTTDLHFLVTFTGIVTANCRIKDRIRTVDADGVPALPMDEWVDYNSDVVASANPMAMLFDTGSANLRYEYQAAVKDVAGTDTYGDWSESLYAWTLPAAPTGLNQTGADTSSITVDWTDTNPAPLQGWSYRYSTVAADGPWTNVDEPTGKPVTIGGFSPETTVYVQARAVSGIEFGSGLPGSYSESLMCTTSSP